jgi:small redox-active disulfide protein 2
MHIKILGTGCARCNALEKVVRETVGEMKIDANIEDVKEINKILEYPILTTPGLVINEELVLAGKVPDKKEIMAIINKAMEKQN